MLLSPSDKRVGAGDQEDVDQGKKPNGGQGFVKPTSDIEFNYCHDLRREEQNPKRTPFQLKFLHLNSRANLRQWPLKEDHGSSPRDGQRYRFPTLQP